MNPGFKTTMSAYANYVYDANDNMTTDLYKKMTVQYNHQNLPTYMDLPSGEIAMTYDAAGVKLKKEVTQSGTTTTKDYVGGIEYADNVLEAIYHEEGRISVENGLLRYEYTLKDHLGNSRVMFADINEDGVIDENTEILQENHYYPFGMGMEGLQTPQVGVVNKYGYNGKEMNDDLGLDWIDYGARWYDPSIAMFQTIDPKAQQFTFQSPYVYAANNPIVYIDENGENPIRAALSIFKAVKRVQKARKRGKKLNFKDLLSDEIQSIIEDGSTILDPNASLLDKAVAAVDLVSGLDVSNYSNKRVKKQSRFLEKSTHVVKKALIQDDPTAIE